MSKLIAIVVGHGPIKDQGAENKDGTTELVWNSDLAERIANHIGPRCPVKIFHRKVEKNPPVAAVNASDASIAVELHLNGYDGSATGTEMIYWTTSKKGKALAKVLQAAAVKVLRLKDRGIKGPQNGRGGTFLSKTKMPAVIVESFFIDNNVDLARGNANKEALAAAYADVLVKLA